MSQVPKNARNKHVFFGHVSPRDREEIHRCWEAQVGSVYISDEKGPVPCGARNFGEEYLNGKRFKKYILPLYLDHVEVWRNRRVVWDFP